MGRTAQRSALESISAAPSGRARTSSPSRSTTRIAGSSDIAFGANFSITATELPAGALPDLVISEVHFGNDGRVDWVELHTPGASAIDVADLSLASLTNLSDAAALTGSVPGGGYASFEVDFPVADNGNINLYLTSGNTVIDARKLDRDLGEESFQSLPVGERILRRPRAHA